MPALARDHGTESSVVHRVPTPRESARCRLIKWATPRSTTWWPTLYMSAASMSAALSSERRLGGSGAPVAATTTSSRLLARLTSPSI